MDPGYPYGTLPWSFSYIIPHGFPVIVAMDHQYPPQPPLPVLTGSPDLQRHRFRNRHSLEISFNPVFSGLLIKNAKYISKKTETSIWVDAERAVTTIRGRSPISTSNARIAIQNLLMMQDFVRFAIFRNDFSILISFVPTGSVPGVKVDCTLQPVNSASQEEFSEAFFDISDLKRRFLNNSFTMDHVVNTRIRFGRIHYRVSPYLLQQVFTVRDVHEMLEASRDIEILMDYNVGKCTFENMTNFFSSNKREWKRTDRDYLKLFVKHKRDVHQRQRHICLAYSPSTGFHSADSLTGEEIRRNIVQLHSVSLGRSVSACVEVVGLTPGQVHEMEKEGHSPQQQHSYFQREVEALKEELLLQSRESDPFSWPVVKSESEWNVCAVRTKHSVSYERDFNGIKFFFELGTVSRTDTPDGKDEQRVIRDELYGFCDVGHTTSEMWASVEASLGLAHEIVQVI